jgi:hypothetical protein
VLESGAAAHDVQALLGHADIKTTSRYLQTNAKRKSQAIDRMERSVRTPFAQSVSNAADGAAEAAISDATKALIQ